MTFCSVFAYKGGAHVHEMVFGCYDMDIRLVCRLIMSMHIEYIVDNNYQANIDMLKSIEHQSTATGIVMARTNL